MTAYALFHGWVQGEIDGIQINGKNYSTSQITTLEADNAALKEALKFYADPSKYPAPYTGGMGALWADCGAKAREALGETRKVGMAPDLGMGFGLQYGTSIDALLRKEADLREDFKLARAKRAAATMDCAMALAALHLAKQELYAAGFTGNIMRDANGERIMEPKT